MAFGEGHVSQTKRRLPERKKIAKTSIEGITGLNTVLCLCVGAVGCSPDDSEVVHCNFTLH